MKFYRFIFILFSLFLTLPVSAMEQDEEVIEERQKPSRNKSKQSLPKETLGHKAKKEAESSTNQFHMKFKVGFEFQEVNGLCPWALHNNNIQKKPLFFLKDKETKRHLWKIVIDTSDIEFVTEPFSYQERPILERGIDTILKAFNTLENLLNHQTRITFEGWTDKIEELKTDFPFFLGYFGTYSSVRDEFIIKPSSQWKPKFAPQVTIQHPLEHAIPLYFGLFGFSSRYMLDFSASLPCRDLFLEAQKEANSENFGKWIHGYGQKMNGLVFLHALTLVQMTPGEDLTDKELLKETYDSLTNYFQVDAKMKLTLMSRRPFSSMFKDIHTQGDYPQYFMRVMSLNTPFYKIPSLFYKTNYAEQFYDSQTGNVKSFLNLLPFLSQDFVTQNNQILIPLLQQGVVSTTMLRKLKKRVKVDQSEPVSTLFNKYFEEAIKTVEFPAKTYIMDTNNYSVQSIPYDHDILSPPLFLDFENSMGRFKDPMTEEEKQCGEAIIEVRAIRDVQSWFLKKCGLEPELTGEFLTKPSPELKVQALCLFDFLKDFGKPSDVIEIYYLGMPYALRY